MIGKLVTDPRAFIRERTKYRGVGTQAIIAIVVGLGFALQHVGSYYQIEEDIAIDIYEVLVLHFSVSMLIPFVVWVVTAVLIAAVSRFLVGGLRTGDVFRLSGWGLAPLVGSGLVQSAGRLYALRGADQPNLGAFSHLQYEWEQYRLYLESANGDAVFIVATVLAVLFVVYTGYIWTVVVEELAEVDGTDIDTGTAALIAGIPALLCLGWVLAPFIL